MSYNTSTALPYNLPLPQNHLGTSSYVTPGVSYNGKMCLFQLYHQNDYGSEVNSQTDSLREISKYHYLTWNFLNWNDQQESVDCKVEELMELDAYDTERVGNTDWSELDHWMHFLNR